MWKLLRASKRTPPVLLLFQCFELELEQQHEKPQTVPLVTLMAWLQPTSLPLERPLTLLVPLEGQ